MRHRPVQSQCECAFATAAPPKDEQDFAILHLKRQVTQRPIVRFSVSKAHLVCLNKGCPHVPILARFRMKKSAPLPHLIHGEQQKGAECNNKAAAYFLTGALTHGWRRIGLLAIQAGGVSISIAGTRLRKPDALKSTSAITPATSNCTTVVTIPTMMISSGIPRNVRVAHHMYGIERICPINAPMVGRMPRLAKKPPAAPRIIL